MSKTKRFGKSMNVTIDDELFQLLDGTAEKESISRSAVIRRLLLDKKQKLEVQPEE